MDQEKISKLKPSGGYVILTMEILEDRTLSAAEKFVLARITGFDKAGGHYESVENTAAALGLSKRMVQYARKHLEELGYIETVGYTDLGTKLIKLKTLHPEPVQNLHGGANNSLEKGGAKSARGCKICQKGVQNLHPIIKGEERISFKDKSLKDGETPGEQDAEPLKEQKTFGNPQVNELMADWTDATGFDHSKIKSERYAMAGLIKQHGYEATKALVRRVKAATRSGDPFAPQIAKASQLRGKYSKLEALAQWERRTQAKAAAEEAKKPAAVPVGLYPEFKPDPYDDIPDTPEAKAQRKATAQALREKYGFGRRAE